MITDVDTMIGLLAFSAFTIGLIGLVIGLFVLLALLLRG